MNFLGVLEVENIDNAEDNQLIQENINARDIENNFPVLYQNRKCYLGNNLLYRQFYNTCIF